MPQAISLSISMILPPSFSTVNLFTNLYQLTKSEATSCNSFQIFLLHILDVQICKGLLLENSKEQ